MSKTKREVETTRHIVGGEELTLTEYAAYMSALSVKPLLTVNETANLFDVGARTVKKLMNSPDCDFTVSASGKGARKIHRASFEKYLMEHALVADKEV
ncbi:helix-turn-helix domain-containing protein [Lacrimispora sp. NSJ-141]|uniref:Helix-turn-helix domain-containing protein n=1 Tax=Lientehia hominis TaxID=2897778 RepID=A0AAP2RKB1_9FIRM|nr:excisionase [Lientehia hominis]MCD2492465.1 helix-turn-helix domain-containing protein [Lientehia hominis]